jgi:hypothetical protein
MIENCCGVFFDRDVKSNLILYILKKLMGREGKIRS